MELVVEVHFLTRRDCFSWRKGKRVGAQKSPEKFIDVFLSKISCKQKFMSYLAP